MQEKDNNEYEISEMATVPLAYHDIMMQRNANNIKRIVIGWVLSIVFIVASFVWLWLQYDYTSTNTATGVYALIDADGNVLAHDLSSDDIEQILTILQNMNGDSQQK